jgi:hypothetical protein
VLPSSCGILIADSKISCAGPPLNVGSCIFINVANSIREMFFGAFWQFEMSKAATLFSRFEMLERSTATRAV